MRWIFHLQMKKWYLVKTNHQIVIYDQPNCLNNDRQLINYKNHNINNISSANSPVKILFYKALTTYNPKKYYDFDPCLGDNNNIKINVRWSITLIIRVEDSNKIKSNNLSTSKCLVINDIRDYIVKKNNT